jgi:hypothetical protein
MISSAIRKALLSRFSANLVNELLECYEEQKRNFLLGNLRPNEVEGGRFAEAAFRLLQSSAGVPMTAIGESLDTERLIRDLQNIPAGRGIPDSVRLHIPRALRVVYDIRNNRDAAHLADGIDPNLQDSTLVSSILDWILAEFVRLARGLSPDEAFSLVKSIMVRRIPAVEDVDGVLKTLRPSLGPGDRVLLILYHRADLGADEAEISGWLKPSQRGNLKRTLRQLEHDKDLIVAVNGRFRITRRGVLEIESRGLVQIE